VRGEPASAEAPRIVAVAAARPEAGGEVVDGDRRCPQVVGLVAGEALHRGAGELAVALIEMALLARDQRVAPGERKLVRRCASALKRLRQLSASWQEAHRVPNSPACTSLWQAAQLVGTAALNSEEAWQDEQVVTACRPRSGNPVPS